MGILKAYKPYILVASIILLILFAAIYGWPRPVDRSFPVTWIDRQNKIVLKTLNAELKGITYHHLFYPDTFNGTVTLGDTVYWTRSNLYEGFPSVQSISEKFLSKGIHVGINESGDIMGWGVLSKDFQAFSGYITLDSNNDIMFAGPARTYEETEGLVNDLLFYDFFH